jgi:hypothetical protein
MSGGRVTEYDQARRLRVLRAAGYRCGHRDQRGILCGVRAAAVDALYRYPVCAEHADAEQEQR